METHQDVMAMAERWLRHVVNGVVRNHGPEIERLFGRSVREPEIPFPRITMAQATAILPFRLDVVRHYLDLFRNGCPPTADSVSA